GRGAVLIDFGLFRRGLTGPPDMRVRGSLPYMAPEYFQSGRLGPWTDIYAIGVTLYRAATGLFPRRGASTGNPGKVSPELDDEASWDPAPRPPSRIRSSLPEDLDNVILKCLALDPRSRFPSAVELLAALELLAGGQNPGHLPEAAMRLTVGRSS